MAALAANLPSGIVAGHFQAVAEAVDVIIGDLAYGDAIMVKGSNGVGLSRIVTEVKAKFAQS
ncbi:UDP-N-acetylmuramoyl-tripeptide--D-alanyl-D-alanine ligase [compost metagenome]